MNEYEMVAFIVLIVMVTIMVTARWKYKYSNQSGIDDGGSAVDPRLEAEVERLRDRVQTLERIAVEKEDSLTRQIEQLRDR
ncbi:MAG: hypothetical protein HKO13_06705 [Sphingomonas sp.]|nr:hypothetical protein [Sphingomonas sp.]